MHGNLNVLMEDILTLLIFTSTSFFYIFFGILTFLHLKIISHILIHAIYMYLKFKLTIVGKALRIYGTLNSMQ